MLPTSMPAATDKGRAGMGPVGTGIRGLAPTPSFRVTESSTARLDTVSTRHYGLTEPRTSGADTITAALAQNTEIPQFAAVWVFGELRDIWVP